MNTSQWIESIDDEETENEQEVTLQEIVNDIMFIKSENLKDYRQCQQQCGKIITSILYWHELNIVKKETETIMEAMKALTRYEIIEAEKTMKIKHLKVTTKYETLNEIISRKGEVWAPLKLIASSSSKERRCSHREETDTRRKNQRYGSKQQRLEIIITKQAEQIMELKEQVQTLRDSEEQTQTEEDTESVETH